MKKIGLKIVSVGLIYFVMISTICGFNTKSVQATQTKKDLAAKITTKPRELVTTTTTKPVTRSNNTNLYNCKLDATIQEWAREQCYINNIEFNIVLAIIEVESNFEENAIGDNGNSIGLMQIQPRWHRERMQKLKCDDLQDPRDNIKVGIDFLAELYKKHGNYTDSLREYNGGTNWQNISQTEIYAKKVLAKARQF